MILRIIIEVILGVILIGLAYSFWDCVKSPKFLDQLLANKNELKRIFDFIGIDDIYKESQNIQPVLGSFSNDMAIWMKASFKALDRVKYMTLLSSSVIILGSYFLSTSYILINIFLFLLLSLFPLTTSAKNNVVTDVHNLFLNVFKWNYSDPVECQTFCNEEQPRLFKNIYSIITETISIR
jgi:hypothetical protein